MLNKLSKSHQTFAFITYARCDSWWEARRFQHLLESYKIPRSLAPKDIRLPDGKYLRKVFVDTSDLPVSNGDFREDIKRELDAAEYLVVLCSQGSARPESYVHEEIRYLRENQMADMVRSSRWFWMGLMPFPRSCRKSSSHEMSWSGIGRLGRRVDVERRMRTLSDSRSSDSCCMSSRRS